MPLGHSIGATDAMMGTAPSNSSDEDDSDPVEDATERGEQEETGIAAVAAPVWSPSLRYESSTCSLNCGVKMRREPILAELCAVVDVAAEGDDEPATPARPDEDSLLTIIPATASEP
uniref:Uncharacterized protein n=1 Tax=Anopheles maculatus TaxID=74869 RepID=A0A182SR73_9DIPT